MVEFLCKRAKRYDIELTPEQLKRVLKKHFTEMVKGILDDGTYRTSRMSFRIVREETVSIARNERNSYVMPDFSCAYSFTLKAFFLERYKGLYYLRPSKEILKLIETKINSSPDIKIRLYGKKAS